MNDLIVQALLAEGVPACVIIAASMRVEMYLAENRAARKVYTQVDRVEQQSDSNPFMMNEPRRVAKVRAV